MNNKLKTTNLFKVLVLCVLFFCVAVIMPFAFAHKTIFANASVINDYVSDVGLANGDFSSYSGVSSIKSPSNWTVVDSSNSDKVKAGVIDVSPNVFKSKTEDYGLTANPSAPPSSTSTANVNILMINSEEDSTSYGYQSSSVTLEANSFYVLSFYSKVSISGQNGASAYVVSDDAELSSNSFVNFVTGDAWVNYSFYIATANKSTSVRLQLFLGSQYSEAKGAVFFDDCRLVRYSENTFEKNFPEYTNLNYRFIDLRPELDFNNQFLNGSFEEAIDGIWTKTVSNNLTNTIMGVTTTDASSFDVNTTKISNAPNSNLLNAKVLTDTISNQKNNRALFINNTSEASAGFSSPVVSFKRMKAYIVNIWVKTGLLSSNGASILLTQSVNEGETAKYSSQFTSITTASASNEITNDWVKYSFYVLGSPFEDVNLELQLWLGSKTLTTRGYVFFDEITVFEISQEEYQEASESTYLKKLSLSDISGSLSIANGAFNLSDGENTFDGVYAPSSWNYNSLTDEIKQDCSGIINTKTDIFNSINTGLQPSQNPGLLPTVDASLTVNDVSNNVLMIRNIAQGKQYFESNDFTLKSGTNLISLYVYSLSDNASIVLLDANNNIVAKFENINEAQWKDYQIFVKLDADAQFKLQLWNGTKSRSTAGYAFFDNVKFTSTDTDLYSVGVTKYTRIVDYTTDYFENTDLNATNDIYNAYLWEYSDVNSVYAGIIDSKNQSLIDYDLKVTDPSKSKVLFIYSPVDINYSIKTKKSYSLEENSYYKVVVRLKTYGLTQSDANKQVDDDGNVIPFGVFVSLTDIDQQFKAINTGKSNFNDWIDYTFYICTGSTSQTSQIVISLGAENALTSGAVFVENASLESISETAYDEAVDALSKKAQDNIIDVKISEKVEENTDDDETNTNSNPFSLGLFDIATIILALAILVAIVGVIVRRIAKNRKKKVVVVNNYDRSSIESAKSIENKIEKLEARLYKLDEELQNIDFDYNEIKADIVNFESMKQGADKAKIVKLNKEIQKCNDRLQIVKDNKVAVEQEKEVTQQLIETERKKLIGNKDKK